MATTETEETLSVEFETMKEFYVSQEKCPGKCEGSSPPRVESVESGVRHMRCRCCGCEWLEHLS